jgi:hypothetical protein
MFFELLISELKANGNYSKGGFDIAFFHIQGIQSFMEFFSIRFSIATNLSKQEKFMVSD